MPWEVHHRFNRLTLSGAGHVQKEREFTFFLTVTGSKLTIREISGMQVDSNLPISASQPLALRK